MLASKDEVAARITELAEAVAERYKGKSPLFVCLLRGGAPFASQLMFALAKSDPHFHPELDYMTVRTYGDSLTAKKPQVIMDLAPHTSVDGRTVVIVDDVLDRGHTAAFTEQHLKTRGAADVELIVLVQKTLERDIWPDATLYGFEAPADWLTGMGMDDPRIATEANRWLDSLAVAVEEA